MSDSLPSTSVDDEVVYLETCANLGGDDGVALVAVNTLRKVIATLRQCESPSLVNRLCGDPRTDDFWKQPSEPSADAEDAAKWRALRNSARITAMGCAGLIGDGLKRPDAHVTLNFWTHNTGGDEQDTVGREWLDLYVVKARLAASEKTKSDERDIRDDSDEFGQFVRGR